MTDDREIRYDPVLSSRRPVLTCGGRATLGSETRRQVKPIVRLPSLLLHPAADGRTLPALIDDPVATAI